MANPGEPSWFDEDLYAELGVDPAIGDAELKKAYQRLARDNHPDRNPGNSGAEAKFKRVTQAYAVLSNPTNREIYDSHRVKTGQQAFQPDVDRPPRAPGVSFAEDVVMDEEESNISSRFFRTQSPAARMGNEAPKDAPKFQRFAPKRLEQRELIAAVREAGLELYSRMPDVARKYAFDVLETGRTPVEAGYAFLAIKRPNLDVDEYLREKFASDGQDWHPILARVVLTEMCAVGARNGEGYAKSMFMTRPAKWLDKASVERGNLVKAAGLLAPNRAPGFGLD